MLIFCKNDLICNLDQAQTIFIDDSQEEGYFINVDFGTASYIIAGDKDRKLMEKVMTDIYMHMTYGSGNYILDLKQFKEERTNEV